MLEAVRVLGAGEEVGDGLCLPLSVTQDAWPCDTPPGASPGASDRGRAQAILPAFCRYPQPLSALIISPMIFSQCDRNTLIPK